LENSSQRSRDRKAMILSALDRVGIFDLLMRLSKRRVAILVYHRFSEKSEPFKLKASVFEKQIQFLKRRWNIISLRDYWQHLNGDGGGLPDNAAIITLDDGYRDNYTVAFPILRKHGVPATIFVTTDFVERRAWLWSNLLEYILKKSSRKTFDLEMEDRSHLFHAGSFEEWHRTQLSIYDHCRRMGEERKNALLGQLAEKLEVEVPDATTSEFEPLTWDEMKEMQQSGIEFGSHTCSHGILSRLSAEELKHEVTDSKAKLEQELGMPVTSFCYPNGRWEDIGDTAVAAVEKAGYKCAVTVIGGVNRSRNQDRFLLKRLCVLTDDRARIMRELTRLSS